jgi:alkylation response protein AidB-like acyl-CoA dehydrogenase
MGQQPEMSIANRFQPVGTDWDLVARAEAMIPALRERAAAAEADRQPSEQTRLDIKRSGIAQLFQPARYGGAEARFRTGVDVLAAIGRGCGSTAWIVVQNITHNMMIASWPEAAQDAVWGNTPDVLVSGILIPGIGKAHKTDGGYVLSGRWPFVSGVNIADWLMFTARCAEDDESAGDRHFLVPRDQATILDTWYTIGLKGSASNDVAVENVFVREHMSVTMEQLKGHGRGPGHRVNNGPVYQIPPYSLFGSYIGSAALGIAEAAVEYYLAGAQRRVASVSGAPVASYTTQQVKVAEAQSAVMTGRRLLYAVCDEAQEAANSGRLTSAEDRTRYRALAAYAGKLSASAVNLVLEAGGGRVIYDRDPLSRCVSDMIVANRHTTQNWDVNASTYGRALLGLPIGDPTLDD